MTEKNPHTPDNQNANENKFMSVFTNKLAKKTLRDDNTKIGGGPRQTRTLTTTREEVSADLSKAYKFAINAYDFGSATPVPGFTPRK